MMNHFIKLGFIGSYKVDLLHYFSRILRELNKEVILIDASKEQYLEYTLPEIKNQDIFTYGGIDCLIHKNTLELINKIDFTGYDIALIDYGLNKEMDTSYLDSDILFIVTDFEKHNIYALKDIIEGFKENINIVMIYRDVIDSKINKKYINYVLKLEEKLKVLAEYCFEFNEEDYRCKLFCQYDNLFSFKKISKGYKVLFADIIEELYGIKLAKVIKTIKACEGGKLCR